MLRQRQRIERESTKYVVGNLHTGRFVFETSSWDQAHDRYMHLTDRRGYQVYSRFQWEEQEPDSYSVAQDAIRRIEEAYEDLNLTDGARVVSANLGMRQRLIQIAHFLTEMANTRKT
jgi:hypothetical protein